MSDSGSMSKDNFKGFKLEMTNKLLDIQPILQKIDIRMVSYEELFEGVDPEKSFIFMDPPYLNQSKTPMYGRKGDTHTGFNHKEYADRVKQIKCKWLITYDDSIKVRRLFKGCNIKPFKLVYTMAGGQQEDALQGEEVFISNYDISDNTSADLFDEL